MRRPEAQRRQGDHALDTCSACAKSARSVFGQARLFAFLLNGVRSTKLVLADSTAIMLASAAMLVAMKNRRRTGCTTLNCSAGPGSRACPGRWLIVSEWPSPTLADHEHEEPSFDFAWWQMIH